MIVDFPGVMTDFADVQFGGFFVHIVEATAMGPLIHLRFLLSETFHSCQSVLMTTHSENSSAAGLKTRHVFLDTEVYRRYGH